MYYTLLLYTFISSTFFIDVNRIVSIAEFIRSKRTGAVSGLVLYTAQMVKNTCNLL